MRDIGKNIRDLREAAGLKQEELAEKLFVTRQTVSNYETGKTRPDVEMIGRLAEVLGTDANTVFYGPIDSAARRRQRRRLTVWGCVLAALALAAFPLHALALRVQTEQYQVWPNAMMSLVYEPLLFFLLGYFALALTRFLLRARPLSAPWVKWARRAALVLTVLAAVLLAPVVLRLPVPTPRPLQYFTILVMAHPALFAIPGAALALLGGGEE